MALWLVAPLGCDSPGSGGAGGPGWAPADTAAPSQDGAGSVGDTVAADAATTDGTSADAASPEDTAAGTADTAAGTADTAIGSDATAAPDATPDVPGEPDAVADVPGEPDAVADVPGEPDAQGSSPCVQAEDCGSPDTYVCDPGTATCTAAQCDANQGCADPNDLCLGQVDQPTIGACYPSCSTSTGCGGGSSVCR